MTIQYAKYHLLLFQRPVTDVHLPAVIALCFIQLSLTVWTLPDSPHHLLYVYILVYLVLVFK